METLDLVAVAPRIQSVLALGMEGAGKTHFIGTFPKPILVYSFDGGYRTLAGVPGIRAKVFLDPDRRKPKAAAEFEVEFRNYVEGKEPPYKWPDGREEAFKTLAIDPLSFWSMAEMQRIQYINHTSDKKMNWDEYEILKKRGIDLLNMGKRLVEELNGYFVATCHVKSDKDEDTGQMWFLPDMAGSIRESIGSHFDAVVYLKAEKKPTGEKEYQMHTVGERRERARLRLTSSLDGVVKAIDVPEFSAVQARLTAAWEQQQKKGAA